MKRRRRLVAIAVVLVAAAFAACMSLGPHESTTEQLSVVVAPNPGDFGDVELGSSGTLPFVVSPAGLGESNDTIQSITACSGFTINAPGVPGAPVFRHCTTASGSQPSFGPPVQMACDTPDERTYPFTATFTPVVIGIVTCPVVIGLGAGSQTFNIKGNGVLPNFAIDARPGVVPFGDIRFTTPTTASSPLNVTVTNVGAMDLSITSVALNDPSNAFRVNGNTMPHTLQFQKSDIYAVQCQPPGTGPFTATLDIKSNATKTPTATVMLTCNGISSNLDIQPTAVSFAQTLVFQPASPATVTLHNLGGASGTINSVVLDAAASPGLTFVQKPANNTPLNAGSSTDVVMSYTPPTAQDGSLGSLIVTFDNVPRTVTISGQALLAKVASEPLDRVEFGPVCLNKTSPSKSLDVYAEQQGVFNVLGGTTMAPFAITGVPPAVLMKPLRGNVAHFATTVHPTMVGPIEGRLDISTDAPMQTTYSVKATATGLPDGITASPAELPLGDVVVQTVSSAKSATFTNCSDATVQVTAERIEGTNAGEFILTKGLDAAVDVAAGATLDIDVQLLPTAVGTKQAQLVIEHTGAGSPSIVALVGEGIPAPRDRGTYYACNGGGGGGLAPLGLAVLALRRRRRK